MPLFIENEDFLVVNACWDDKHIDWIKQNYKGKLTDGFLAKTVNDKMSEYHVIEETLKGKEKELSNYWKNSLGKDGLYAHCKTCHTAQSKKTREKYREKYNDIIYTLKQWGLEVIKAKTIFRGETVFSGLPSERAEEFNKLFSNKLVKAIFDMSGGESANQMLDYIC